MPRDPEVFFRHARNQRAPIHNRELKNPMRLAPREEAMPLGQCLIADKCVSHCRFHCRCNTSALARFGFRPLDRG